MICSARSEYSAEEPKANSNNLQGHTVIYSVLERNKTTELNKRNLGWSVSSYF